MSDITAFVEKYPSTKELVQVLELVESNNPLAPTFSSVPRLATALRLGSRWVESLNIKSETIREQTAFSFVVEYLKKIIDAKFILEADDVQTAQSGVLTQAQSDIIDNALAVATSLTPAKEIVALGGFLRKDYSYKTYSKRAVENLQATLAELNEYHARFKEDKTFEIVLPVCPDLVAKASAALNSALKEIPQALTEKRRGEAYVQPIARKIVVPSK